MKAKETTMNRTAKPEVDMSRLYRASADSVFDAWVNSEDVAQWWGPEGFTNPVCKLDPRPGGALYIEMRGPDGVTYPMRGTFEVVSPPSEIVFTSAALDDAGHAMFETRFAVAFEAVGADTRLSVRGELISEAPDTRQFSEGMEAGWMQMLDKLETFLDGTADREIRLMRLISAPPDAVYAAWTDPDRVGRWWGPDGFTVTTRSMNVTQGGEWDYVMHGPDGVDYQNLITYQEIVPGERLVYAHGGSRKHPADFHTTVTFAPFRGQTALTMRCVFPSAEERDRTEREYHATEGGNQTLNRLEAHLAP